MSIAYQVAAAKIDPWWPMRSAKLSLFLHFWLSLGKQPKCNKSLSKSKKYLLSSLEFTLSPQQFLTEKKVLRRDLRYQNKEKRIISRYSISKNQRQKIIISWESCSGSALNNSWNLPQYIMVATRKFWSWVAISFFYKNMPQVNFLIK